MTKLLQHGQLLMAVVLVLGITSLCVIYAGVDSTTMYMMLQRFSSSTNLILNTEKRISPRKDFKTASSYTKSLTNTIYQSNRDIRVLSKKALRNIIVDNYTDCPKRKFLVYKCSKYLCGGWGDREKGIVSSFLLALLTNRSFVIQMEKPCGLENFIDPFIYNWTKCKKFLNTIPASDISEESHISGNRKFYNDIANIDFEKLWTKQKIVLYMNAYDPVMTGIKLHKHADRQMRWIISMTNPEIVHLVLHTLFTPKQRLRDHLSEFIRYNTKGRHLVCSHIRIGKNPSNPSDNFLPMGKPHTETIFLFLERFQNPVKYAMYVASDSNDVRQDAMTKFQNAFTINRTIVHVDRFKSAEKSTNVCEGFFTVVLEQQMLTLCDTILITRSNFGAIAAYMRGSSENVFLYNTKLDRVFATNLTGIQSQFKFV